MPKPFLIDTLGFDSEANTTQNETVPRENSLKDKEHTVISNDKRSWMKVDRNDYAYYKGFQDAVDNIRKKGKDMNIIDERLFRALNIPLPL
jgi:hypothetical protein